MAILAYKHVINPLSAILYIVLSIAIPAFLLYLDEGYCNFDWTQTSDGRIMFAAMFVSLLSGLLAAHYLFFKTHSGFSKIGLTLVIGIPLGVTALIGMVVLTATISYFLS